MLIGVIAGRRRVPTGPSPLWSRQNFAFATANWYLGSYDTYTYTNTEGQPAKVVLAGDQPWRVKINKGVTPIDTTVVSNLYFVVTFKSLFDDNGTWTNPGFGVTISGEGGTALKNGIYYPDEEFIGAYGEWAATLNLVFFVGSRPLFGDIKSIEFSNAGQGSERIEITDLFVNEKPVIRPTGPVALWNEWYWNAFNHHIEGGNAANTAHPNWNPYKTGVAGQHERKLSITSQQPLELAITPRNSPTLPALCKAFEINLELPLGSDSDVKPITFELRDVTDVIKGVYRWTPTLPLTDSGNGSHVAKVRVDLPVPSGVGAVRVLDPNPLGEVRVNRTLRDPVFIADDGGDPAFTSTNYTEGGSVDVMVWEAKPDKPAEQQLRVEGIGPWSVEMLFNGTTGDESPVTQLWIEVDFLSSFQDGTAVPQDIDIEVYNNADEVINAEVTYSVYHDKISTNGGSRQHFRVLLTEGGPYRLSDIKLVAMHYQSVGGAQTMVVRNITTNVRPALQSIGPVPFWHNWYWAVENKLDSTKALSDINSLLWQDNGYADNHEYFATRSQRPLDLWFTPRNGAAIPAVTKAVKVLFNYTTNPGDVLFEVIGTGNAVLGSLLWNTSVSAQVNSTTPLELVIELTTPGQVTALRMFNNNPNNADLGYRYIRGVQFSADGVYALWNGPGWFDASDSSTVQQNVGVVTGLLNKRKGFDVQRGFVVNKGDLVAGGGTTRTISTGVQNGRNALAITRDAVAPVRFVADSTTAVSQAFQGNDKPFTVIVAYRPTDTNNGYIWSGSRTVDSSNEHVVGLVRRSTPNCSARKQTAANNAPDVNWGTGQAQNVNRIVAIRHTGTAVTVWDTGLTKAVDNAAQDTVSISTLAKFVLFAAQTKGSSEGYALVQSSKLFFEIVVEDKVRTDAEITKAMTDMAAKWGITLGA